MRKKKLWIGGGLLLALLLYAVIFAFRTPLSDYGLPLEKLTVGQNTLAVEVVDTEDSRAKGLMLRTFLPANQGMLFVWPDDAPRTMWMKDTFIPLDIVFIEANGKIAGIVENAEPHNVSPLGTDRPVRYVLEVPAGDAKRLEMAVGQTVVLP
jgi:uncharacterized membrane protein (UPF0127 family)